MRHAAKACGIDYNHFVIIMNTQGLTYLFKRPRRPNHNDTMVFIKEGISVEDVRNCHGLLMKDAADILGIDSTTLSRKIKAHFPELRKLFPARGGEAQNISRKGYTS
jgi:hypothetical protein